MDKHRGVIDEPQSCLECGQFCSNRRSLGNHMARSHKMLGGLHGYVLKHFLNGQVPLCKCGCGKSVAWKKVLYVFGDFINGHNHRFSSKNQPNFTKEQIEKRNVAIRLSYCQNKVDIAEKISKSVRQTLSTPKGSQMLSDVRKKMWSDPDMHSRLSKSRQRTWDEQHDELVKKIFTPDFGRKISQANMNRDVKRQSKKELAFIKQLSTIGFNVEGSKWFNFTVKTWCADAWLPKHGAIVEYDGSFWHGLDKEQDFSLSQIQAITNDLIKNKIAIDKKLTLIRIKEDTTISHVKTFDDLCNVAYHLVIAGNVIKEGSFCLGDSQPIMTRDNIIKRHMNGLRDETENVYLPALESLLKAYEDYWGWFYPPCKDDLKTILTNLVSAAKVRNEFNSSSRSGSSFLKSVFHSFWNVDGGPISASHDQEKFRRVLRYRLGLNNSKNYTYYLADGKKIETNEHFDISLRQIRKGLIVQRNSVSWFKPLVAADVWLSLLGTSITSPNVWDPSGGFGARAIGFSAMYPEGTYTCCEPATQVCSDFEQLRSIYKNEGIPYNLNVLNVGSESNSIDIQDSSIDAIFTSPPYFDLERYFDEPTQCWKRFNSLDVWLEGYLLPTFRTARRVLKPGCKMAININEMLRDEVIDSASAEGFRLVDEWKLMLRADHFARKRGSINDRSEPIFVFE